MLPGMKKGDKFACQGINTLSLVIFELVTGTTSQTKVGKCGYTAFGARVNVVVGQGDAAVYFTGLTIGATPVVSLINSIADELRNVDSHVKA